MRGSTDSDAWTCPDCHDTTRGPIEVRVAAQLEHGAEHRKDKAVQEARRIQEEEERVIEREERRRARHARKAQARARQRGR